jgi:SAM-dependent methyltransferase
LNRTIYDGEVRQFVLRAMRRLLREVDIRIERERHGAKAVVPTGNGRAAQIEKFLRDVEMAGDGERAYLEVHLARLVRTLSLAPPNGRRALELGSYVYTAAALERVLGYSSVRGAYYSATPGNERKVLKIAGQPDFACEIDLFDAERHPYPYPGSSFDLVLCCELIEHLLQDPMHLLFECHRILAEG